MPAFRELYTKARRLDPDHYARRLLSESLSTRAVLPGPVCAVLLQRALRAERELISVLGRVTSFAEFEEEIYYFANRRSLAWWRRRVGLRLSLNQLRSIGKRCFDSDQSERAEGQGAAGRS
jgi:hypothetical protein